MRIETIVPLPLGSHRLPGVILTVTHQGTFMRLDDTAERCRAADEQRVQGYAFLARQSWTKLSQAQRGEWKAYASRHLRHALAGCFPPGPKGLRAYVQANVMRQLLGLSFLSDAPVQPPPEPLSDFQAEPVSDERELLLTVRHPNQDVRGLVVFVKVTPTLSSYTRDTPEDQLCLARKAALPSACPLAASGGQIRLRGLRFPLPDRARFGVELCVVRRSDGMTSWSCFDEAVRQVLPGNKPAEEQGSGDGAKSGKSGRKLKAHWWASMDELLKSIPGWEAPEPEASAAERG